jgi:uncharacterized RDD family membrane protein YckC
MTDQDLQQKRLIAAAIDIAIYVALAVGLGIMQAIATFALARSSSVAVIYAGRILNFGMALVSLAYVLGRDVLGNGRSLGKKFQDIRVVTVAGAPVGLIDSVKRNAIFAIGTLLGVIAATLRLVPCLGDAVVCLMTPLFFLALLLLVAAVIVEIVKITQDAQGVRFGDEIAGTRVVR